MAFVCLNGEILPHTQPALLLQNRGFKFGDGLFETMRMEQGRIPLEALHRERLWQGMHQLQLPLPMAEDWQRWLQQMTDLAVANGCSEQGRVRLTVFREEAAYGYAMEAVPLQPSYLSWHEAGERLVLFTDGRKTIDAFSNIKSTSYQLYVMAGLFAQNSHADDALVLNVAGNICDTSRANVFVIKDGRFFTPSLNQGCVSGVMRRQVIDNLRSNGQTVEETTLSVADLLEADEILLTNALYGIRWVSSFQDRTFQPVLSKQLYHNWLPTIFS